MAFQFNFSIDETADNRSEAPGNGKLQQTLVQDAPVLMDNQESPLENSRVMLLDTNVLTQTPISEMSAHMADPSLLNNHVFSLPENHSYPAVAKEHNVPKDISKVLESKMVRPLLPLCHVHISVVDVALSNDSHGEDTMSKSISSHSDLVKGVYEGGLKVWECTFDLIDYLAEAEIQFAQKVVLDLGCGAGLLGIVALKGNAGRVHFQDYNSRVMEEATLPNVLLNCTAEARDREGISEPPLEKNNTQALLSKCKFFSGEWSEFSKLLLNSNQPLAKYDLILTSETIYNPDYYEALHETLTQLLEGNGCVYLASKAHYFGCGGGVLLFTKFIEEKNVFVSRTVKIIDKGLTRFIIELRFKNAS